MIKKIKNKKTVKKIDKEWQGYYKKNKTYFIRIFLYSLILAILITFFIGAFIYDNFLKNLDQKTELDLKKHNNSAKNRLKKTKDNLSLLDKYNKNWKDIKKNQLVPSGINFKTMKELLEKLKIKYNIQEYDLKMTMPQKFNYNKNKTLETFYSNCNLSFTISDDIRARGFISDLENTIFGYIIIKNLSITKSKNYEFEDLLQLSKKKSSGLINVKIDFDWYSAKKLNKI